MALVITNSHIGNTAPKKRLSDGEPLATSPAENQTPDLPHQ